MLFKCNNRTPETRYLDAQLDYNKLLIEQANQRFSHCGYVRRFHKTTEAIEAFLDKIALEAAEELKNLEDERKVLQLKLKAAQDKAGYYYVELFKEKNHE